MKNLLVFALLLTTSSAFAQTITGLYGLRDCDMTPDAANRMCSLSTNISNLEINSTVLATTPQKKSSLKVDGKLLMKETNRYEQNENNIECDVKVAHSDLASSAIFGTTEITWDQRNPLPRASALIREIFTYDAASDTMKYTCQSRESQMKIVQKCVLRKI
jgi:hypothetical protein